MIAYFIDLATTSDTADILGHLRDLLGCVREHRKTLAASSGEATHREKRAFV